MEPKEIIDLAHEIHKKEILAAQLDFFIKTSKEKIKKALETKHIMEFPAEDLIIILKNVPETKIADADAMKAAGVFDNFSKLKKGYTSVTIKEIKS